VFQAASLFVHVFSLAHAFTLLLFRSPPLALRGIVANNKPASARSTSPGNVPSFVLCR
jgi:hypothetical protein